MSFLFDDFARCNATSQFQITRCAQNRLPHQQPAPAPNSAPTAIALRSPYCLPNVPRTPQRTPRPHNLAHPRPIRSPVPEKTSLLRATRSQPCLIQPHTRLTSSPLLRHFSPPIPRFRQPSGNIRTYVLPSPSRGTDPAARKPYPQSGVRPQASVGASNTGH